MTNPDSEAYAFAASMSRRLGRLLFRVRGRNLTALFAHIDADAIRELPRGRVVRTICISDWATMRTVEAGICWRDPAATRGGR